MGKRLQRISKKHINKELPQLINKELDLILENNAVYHCVILSVTDEEIIIRDFIRNKHTIKITNIQEIILDNEAEY